MKRILIIVQNLPVPFDRRVWLECQALTGAGYQVAVVCPKGKRRPGVRGHRRRWSCTSTEPYAPGGSKLSFVAEYAYSFARDRMADVLQGRGGRGRFAVIQACNPPDIFWPLAIALQGGWTGPSSCSTTTTCAPSCSSPASRRPRAALQGAAVA